MYSPEIANEFFEMMKRGLEMGHNKYGDDFMVKDLNKDIQEELRDVATYALLTYMRLRMFQRDPNGHKVEIQVTNENDEPLNAEVRLMHGKIQVVLLQ